MTANDSEQEQRGTSRGAAPQARCSIDNLATLIRRRTLIASGIRESRSDLQRLNFELSQLDAQIQDLNPNRLLPLFRNIKAVAGPTGDMTRIVLDTLEQSSCPLTAKVITQRAMVELGLDANDSGMAKKMMRRVCVCLWTQAQFHRVRRMTPKVRPQFWELVPAEIEQ